MVKLSLLSISVSYLRFSRSSTYILLLTFSSALIRAIVIRRFTMLTRSSCLPIAIHGDKYSIRKRNTFRIFSRSSMGHIKMYWERIDPFLNTVTSFIINFFPTLNPCRCSQSTNVDMIMVNDYSRLCLQKILVFISYIEKRRKIFFLMMIIYVIVLLLTLDYIRSRSCMIRQYAVVFAGFLHSLWIQILIAHPWCHSWRTRFVANSLIIIRV